MRLLPCLVLLSICTVALATGPSGYWRFEDPSQPGKDFSGNGRDLEVVDAIKILKIGPKLAATADPVPGTGEANGTELSIAAESGALFADDGTLFGGQTLTVEAFVSPIVPGRFGHIASRWGGSQNAWRLAFNTTNFTLVLTLSPNSKATVPFKLDVPDTLSGGYPYVAATIEPFPSGMRVTLHAQKLSKGGTLISSITESGDLNKIYEGHTAFSIGGRGSTTGQNWRGRIDEVRFTLAALAPSELLISAAP